MIRVDLNRILLLMINHHLFDFFHWLCLIELIITVVCEYLFAPSWHLTCLPLIWSLIPHHLWVLWLLTDPGLIRPHTLIRIVSLVLRHLTALYLDYPELLHHFLLPHRLRRKYLILCEYIRSLLLIICEAEIHLFVIIFKGVLSFVNKWVVAQVAN